MDSVKYEKKMLRYTYLLCVVLFVNLYFVAEGLQVGKGKSALIMGVIVCVLSGYSHFIIRRFFPDGDKYILLFANVLAVIGIAMLYRLDMPIAGGVLGQNAISGKTGQWTFFAVKQLIWVTLGVAAFVIVVVLLPSLKNFSKYKYFYLVCTLIFMSVCTFLGTEKLGAKNWIIIGGFSFQPTEFGKITLVLYLAAALEKYGKRDKKTNKSKERLNNLKSLLEPAIVVMISLGFMVLQKDLGSALIFFGVSVTMLYITTSEFKYVALCLVLFALGGFISYKLFAHVRVRVLIWQDPFKYANDMGYQLVQSLVAIASGGFLGSGIGSGYPRFVPVRESDFIFSAIGEEMGLLMGFAIIIVYFLLFYRCMRASVYAKDKFSRLLAVGYSTVIASQVLVIIGGVVGAIPLTGITMPLVSYGGSSILITFFSLGILQKISEEG